MSIRAIPSLSGLRSRYVQFVLVAGIVSLVGLFYLQQLGTRGPTKPSEFGESHNTHHPIDTLRRRAEQEWKDIQSRRTEDVRDAAREYRLRRGRHPPPGFEAWYGFAQSHDAVMVEEFWDQIYTDLNPFWGVPAKQIRQQAKTFEHTISVRDGTATWKSDEDRIWMKLWHETVQTVASNIPDVDIGINVMDESRVVVPWKTIDGYMKAENATRRILDLSEVISGYSGLSDVDQDPGEPFNPEWHNGQYWELARQGCHPDSAARTVEPSYDYSGPPPLPTNFPEHSYEGYIVNWTLAKDPCAQPNLQQLHGTFVEPISMSTTSHLLPIFGGSKLPMNNEILLPPAMYSSDDPFYSGGGFHGMPWTDKQDRLIWRGSASGGRNTRENWTRFQRHRFVSMVNGTSVRQAEMSSGASEGPPNFELPPYSSYNLRAPRNGLLGDWISAFSDAAFTHLLCFPDEGGPYCSYTNDHYEVKPAMPMSEQYAAKYLPDIDGNSYSGRYRGFLLSTSLPIKATIYNEWHDSRLMPWLHFVPMDNSFVDIYGIMDYFLGYDGHGGRDDVARQIADGGKEWAEKVLRREDMQIYVYRLLLEFARVCDDERERLGYVDDLVQST